MHEHDLCAGVNGQVITGRHLHLWTAFKDFLELHKHKTFTSDMAKKQQYYIQQRVCRRATLCQHILSMGVLKEYVRYLSMLTDSPKAVPKRKKGNVPFS
jgi:hypothetical protein